MLRKLTAIAAGVAAGLVVVSAFAQTTTPPKKKKKHKHPTAPAAAAPAAGAPAAAAPATKDTSPELYVPPPEPAETSAPAPSAAPSSEPAPKAAADTTASGAPEAPAPKDDADKKSLPPFSAAILGGWGFNGAAKLGLGLRAGYTLPMHVYVGATFVYHLGESEGGATASFFYPGAEGGYELTLGPVLVRPYVGVGALVLHESLPPQSASKMYFALWPGVMAAYPITPMFFVGADARYTISGYGFLGLFATFGARF